MTFGGACLGKADGKAVFIPYAVPGETLSVDVTEEKRDYNTARIVEILTPSPHRVQPICPLYGTCGGCNMMHIDDAYQQELRAGVLKDTFERAGIVPPQIQIIAGSASGYRSRFQFHNGSLQARRSNTEFPLTYCPVAVKEINDWLASVPQSARPSGRVHVFGGSFAEPNFVIAEAAGMAEPVMQPRSAVRGKGRRTVGKKATNRHFAGTLPDPAFIVQARILNKTVKFDVRGFFQSNIPVLEKAVETLCEDLSGRSVLDMYAGAGTFSVFLADKFECVTMVEHNRDALAFAEINMAGTVHESYGISGEKWTAEHAETIIRSNGSFDAVVIDPPRSGMETAVCKWLCENHPRIIRSVSCDPATHARDIVRLVQAGYTLERLYLLDFYPQTSHIESLAFLSYHA